ncbi:MAG: CHAT domain-containing protein, partial [Bryobacteraceae bacterium]
MDRHSLQIVPGASLLRTQEARVTSKVDVADGGRGSRWLLAVGDPIYNAADPRWMSGTERRGGYSRRTGTDEGEDGVPRQFARLVGSAGEVRAVAGAWGAQSGMVTVLEGSQARRGTFCNLLQKQPSVIHLATHVAVNPMAEESGGEYLGDMGTNDVRNGQNPGRTRREQSFIAFSLGTSGGRTPATEVLSTTEIAGLRVPGALVVMSGCDSGVGDAVAGAGLLGLSRSWLMAGARG